MTHPIDQLDNARTSQIDSSRWQANYKEAKQMRHKLQPVDGRPFSLLVGVELQHARAKFPEPESIPENWTEHQLMHYWLGVIEEEFEEIKKLVFSREYSRRELLSELVQTAAMCQRAAESCGLCDPR